MIIGGPTDVGKAWVASTLAHQPCRKATACVTYTCRACWEELGLADGDGRFVKLMRNYTKTDLLTVDHYGLAQLTAEQSATYWNCWTTARASARSW